MLIPRTILGLLLAAPLAAQLNGIYTIHPLQPTGGVNFQTIGAALQALHSQPLTGPTTFLIFDDAGPWTEANPVLTYINGGTAVLSLQAHRVVGLGAANPLVFTAGPGESPVFDAVGQPFGIVLHGAQYVTVQGIEVKNATSDGVSIYTDANSQAPADLHGNAVIGCRIHDIGGCGINVYQNGGTPAVAFVGTIIRNNFLWRCQTTHAGGNAQWRNGYLNERRSRAAVIENNTFFADTAVGTTFGVYCTWYAAPLGGPAASFVNNVIVKTVNNGNVIRHIDAASTPLVQDHNAYEDTSGGQFLGGLSGTAATFAAFQAAFPTLDPNGVSGPVLLVNGPGGDLHISAGSVAVDRGMAIAGLVTDIDGQGRPSGLAFDAGADELWSNVAAVNLYGSGCMGSNGVPTLSGAGVPSLGNSAFALNVGSARGNSFAILFAALGANVPGLPLGGGCLLHLQQSTLGTIVLVGTSANGSAAFPIPVPNNPNFAGMRLFFQTGVLDPTTVLGASATNAAEVVVY